MEEELSLNSKEEKTALSNASDSAMLDESNVNAVNSIDHDDISEKLKGKDEADEIDGKSDRHKSKKKKKVF